ncbi:alpha-L-arabinofuranosidase C-terminal domain-containing protein [Clostridium sp.]|uniref:alpha-L-arabinofuranosidase C-terminal domain-containing protein n=1 Tax=Clostridium sp. TaxID=1506 RepID=UPI002840F873|nr:alpha-L-arabinofuranosidase C-terminal domain-containing protein [Clostridium sp.]MDR3598394.1 alpha-L-arabinofuranosidase C-terminal domain-containing protein [Clostridium sp.]
MEEKNTCTITLNMESEGIEISPMLYGLFFEDINFAGDGGIYGELIKNRSFEYFDINGVLDKRLMGWEKLESKNGELEIEVLTDKPLNINNTNYLHIDVKKADDRVGIKNLGFNDIGFSIIRDEKYDFSMFARSLNGDKTTTVIAAIQNADTGEIYGETSFEIVGDKWKKYEMEIVSNATFANAIFVLLFKDAVSLDIDMLSLFPQKTFNNRKNGLRADLVQMLKDIKPSFLRFPGGCIVEGRSFENMYRWKETIGEISERKINWNRWQLQEYQLPNQNSDEYFQSYGLGFYEYFLLCEDIGAEAVPILNVGMTCQWHEGLLVEVDELDEYIQDVLDLIEYANGDETTTWGKKRIEAGHSEPFNLKYIGIGNEQWDEQYFKRYEIFHKVIKSRYPGINLITSAGWTSDGKEFDKAYEWMKITEQKAELVDEHFYKEPTWFIESVNRYDNYDRNLPKVFAGEYAAHTSTVIPERRNNWEAALSEAAFLTGIEKNSDHVLMASYAPLFGKTGYCQWQPNLIWFNNSEVYGTPSYYVQQIFSTNVGDRIIKTEISDGATTDLYVVSSFDKKNSEIIIKVVNLSYESKRATIKINEIKELSSMATAIELSSKELTDENSYEAPMKISPVTKIIEDVNEEFTYEFQGYGVTALRLRVK